jgi:hypothetical protein
MVKASGRRPRKREQPPNLLEWVNEYPEAKVTRRELYVILSQILGPPSDEPGEPKEIEA